MTKPIPVLSPADTITIIKSNLRQILYRSSIILTLSILSLDLNGCAKFSDMTGTIGASSQMPKDEAGIRAYTEAWGQRYEKAPKDKTTGMNYARGLRAQTQYAQAIAVLENLAISNPKDGEILAACLSPLKLSHYCGSIGRVWDGSICNWTIGCCLPKASPLFACSFKNGL